MERVGILIDKLQKQFQEKADVPNLLITVQLLQNELLLNQRGANGHDGKKVSVVVPNAVTFSAIAVEDNHPEHSRYKPLPKPEVEPAPVAEPEPEPEPPINEPPPQPGPKPESEPIPHFVEQNPWLSVFPAREEKKGTWALDPVLEVPTLAHQEKIVYELNDTMMNEGALAINDKLKQNKSEMVSVLQDSPIKDLKRAISINDRHRFINELFRDDENMYERSIKTINGFHILAEAEFWIQRELKLKLGWNINSELVKTFDHLVKRRFS